MNVTSEMVEAASVAMCDGFEVKWTDLHQHEREQHRKIMRAALEAAIALMRGHSDMVLVPRTLTAENGAKGALIGEFTTPFVMQCLECTDGFVDDEVCDDCDGAGSFTVRVPVEWTTIKDIHKAMIAHFHPAPKDTGDAVTGRVNGYMFSARAIEIITDGEVPEWITKAPGLRVTITAMQAKEAK